MAPGVVACDAPVVQTVPTPTFAADGVRLEPEGVRVVALERFTVLSLSMEHTWSCGRCRASVPIGASWWLTFRDRANDVHRAVLCHGCAAQFPQGAET